MNRRFEQPPLSEPRCSVSLQDYAGQPSDDHDRRFKTLLLTFRVRLSRPLHVDPDGTAFYYRRKFSEPLTVITHRRRGRDKVGRMLDAVRVPRRGTESDLVGQIINSVRRIEYDTMEDPPAVLRVKVEVDAVVLNLPPLSESERDRYDDGPPIYLDGPNSRNYSDDDDDSGLDDDDDGVLSELRDTVVVQGGRGEKRILITLKAEFSLPPPDYSDSVVCTQRTFSETLDMMVDQWNTSEAVSRLALMLQWLRVPQGRRRVGLANKILGGVRSAAERRHGNFSVMEVAVDLRVVVFQFPILSPSEQRNDMPAIHLDDHSTVQGYINLREPGGRRTQMDFERRLAAANRESIEGLEKVRVVSTTGCSVCLEDILVGAEATLLPCSHLFHGDCIVKWLEKSMSCPLCRFELPS